MDIRKLRAYWFDKQGLGGSLKGESSKHVFERAGWARSVGGANPYLTLFSRAGVSKADAEFAVSEVEIHELPAARGCTYVMSELDYALALRLSRGTGDPADLSVAKKWLGVTDEEIANLQEKVFEVVNHPMDPKEIREAVGDAVRSLGDEGKKRGQTTTLPIALGLLQSDGHIRRVPVDGRLDQQRYKYVRWDPSPMEGFLLSYEEACVEFARKYFSWIGPATRASFQAISGLGVKASEAALKPLDLVPVEEGSPFLIFAEEKKEFDAFTIPAEPRYALVSCLDSLSHFQWGFQNLVDQEDQGRAIAPAGTSALSGFSDVENHAIYDRGRLVGLWEFDPGPGEIVYQLFVELNSEIKGKIDEMQEFGRSLGDIRSFSLDSPESRKPRLDALRRGQAPR